MSSTPNVALCVTAAHLEGCGECADVIGQIVKSELEALSPATVPVPEAPAVEAENFDADGVKLSGMITSHADVPNAMDHPIEYAGKCGLCIANKRKAQQRGGSPDAVLSALERL